MLDHTFVVLAYKESEFLRSCLESLRAQQKAPSQIIVSTSTPSPFIEGICREFSLPLRVNEAKGGIASDWNFAYQQAATKYVTLAHQDDIYEPDYSARMVACIEERPDTLFGFSDYYEIISGKRRDRTTNLMVKRILRAISLLHQRHVVSLFRKRLLLAFGCPIPCPTVIFNRERLASFRFSAEFSINLDWEAWCRLATLDGSIAYVRSNLVGHRLHAESETTAGIRDCRRVDEDVRMFHRIWPAPVARLISWVYELGYHGNSSQ